MPSFHYHKRGKKNDFAFPFKKIRGPIFANQTRILLPIFMTEDVLDSDVLDDLLDDVDLDQLQEEGIDLGEMMSYLEEGGEEEEESTRRESLGSSPPFPKRITPHQRMKLNCRTFSLLQRGPTCFMASATLIVGRTLLPLIKKKNIRNFILRSHAEEWDEAYGPEGDATCPNIPASIRKYYFRYSSLLSINPSVPSGTTFLHSHVNNQDEYVRTFYGGHPGPFLSSLLWASFTASHGHVDARGRGIWCVGEEVTVVRPRERSFAKCGRVVSVNEKTQTATLHMMETAALEDHPFYSLRSNTNGSMYPFPEPLPFYRGSRMKTLLACFFFQDEPLTYIALWKALPDIPVYARASRLRVLGMFVTVPGHVIAAFPCPKFPNGWMFCNSWSTFNRKCYDFHLFFNEMRSKGLTDGGIPSVGILYDRM